MAITKDKTITVKFESDLIEKIENYATAKEMDRSKVIRFAVKEFFGKLPADEPKIKGSLRKAV